MLCLDLPHLEVKFKIVKEFTFRSQKKDGGGHRVRSQENRGPEGIQGVGSLDPPLLSPAPTRKGSRSETFHFRWEEVLASQILPEFESQGRSNIWLEFVAISYPWGLFLEGPGNYRARGRAEPKRLVWSWSLNECLALASAVKGFSRFIDPTAMPCWWAPIKAKQLSMAATARVIWLCACVRYWTGRGLVYVCSLLYVCPNLKART